MRGPGEAPAAAGAPVGAAALRAVMGRFATGVAVITTAVGDRRHGMTVNSLTSVSLDPPLVLVCFVRPSRTGEAVVASGAFAVNILGERQRALSDRFARRGEDHFAGLASRTVDGLPVLPTTLGLLVCDVDTVTPAGDHDVVIGRVRSVRAPDPPARPLVFFGGRYDTVTGHGSAPEELWLW